MKSKNILLYGPAQSGKTIFCNKVLQSDKNYIVLDIHKYHTYQPIKGKFHSSQKDLIKILRKYLGKKIAVKMKVVRDYSFFDLKHILYMQQEFFKKHPKINIIFRPGCFSWINKDFKNDETLCKIFLYRDPRIDWITHKLDLTTITLETYIRRYKRDTKKYIKYKDYMNLVGIKSIYEDFPIPDVLNKDICFGNQTTEYDHFSLFRLNEGEMTRDLKIINDQLCNEIKFLQLPLNYTVDDFVELCEQDKKKINEYNLEKGN